MYTKTIRLKDHEASAKVDMITGEFSIDKARPNNIPEDKERFHYDERFEKAYSRSWMYLADHLSGVELKIAVMMASMTEFGTNSLAPLDNNISYELLADKFSISKSTVKKAFDNLFEVGVYASFKYCHFERGPVEEWVFNPFISFRGKLIDSDLKNLFLNTRVAKHFLRQ